MTHVSVAGARGASSTVGASVVAASRLYCAGVSVSRLQDDIAFLKRNKVGVRFSELVSILRAGGWEHRSTNGSHYVYAKKARQPILLVKAHGNNKYCYPMDVNKVIAALEADLAEVEAGSGDSDEQAAEGD